MAFNHKYNTDDSIIRANIVGLVNELNNQIKFQNVWGDNSVKEVKIPWFYAMSGDENFLQDYFSNWSDCAPDFIEGNTDPIPRGTVFMTGYSVMSANLTSRYVRGYYTKEVDGQLKRFNSYINSIPIQMNFSAEILVDTSIDSFKIAQAITGYLYRTQTFSVNFKGFRVPTQIGFPDTYNNSKQFEFTYGVTDRLKTTFDIELQSFLPITDDMNEMFAGNNIKQFSDSDVTETGLIHVNIDLKPGDFAQPGQVLGSTGGESTMNPGSDENVNTNQGGGNISSGLGSNQTPDNSQFNGNNWIGPE